MEHRKLVLKLAMNAHFLHAFLLIITQLYSIRSFMYALVTVTTLWWSHCSVDNLSKLGFELAPTTLCLVVELWVTPFLLLFFRPSLLTCLYCTYSRRLFPVY